VKRVEDGRAQRVEKVEEDRVKRLSGGSLRESGRRHNDESGSRQSQEIEVSEGRRDSQES